MSECNTSSYRSSIFKLKNMAGARSLWKATGFYDKNKPLIAVVNSFCEFVPGHVHLQPIGRMVCEEIIKAGGVPKEFNTIALDDGIAMGHEGMLYSLPSRDIIADSVECMINGHKVDGMICISNCDKITPGMLIASMRLNIPTIFVSGGPMEAGTVKEGDIEKSIDLVDAIIVSGNNQETDEKIEEYENSACPTCGSCSGMFTANSMNCLVESLGLGLAGNGSLLATHQLRKDLFIQASQMIVDITKKHYLENNQTLLPRSICTKQAFQNAMCLDIAMGGSTNTILHILAIAKEAEVEFSLEDIHKISQTIPNLCKIAPSSSFHMEDFHRAGGVMSVLKELKDQNFLDCMAHTIYNEKIGLVIDKHSLSSEGMDTFYRAAPGGVRTTHAFSQNKYYKKLDMDRENGCIRSYENAHSKDGGLAILYGNIAEQGCVVKTAGVESGLFEFSGKAVVFESQEDAMRSIITRNINAGDVVVIRYEGPKGGPGMQEMLYPTSYLKSIGLGSKCALITDGRFSGGTAGLCIGHISPEAAEGGLIGVIKNGDPIKINIHQRSIILDVDENEIQKRIFENNQKFGKNWKPEKERVRKISKLLQMYAHTVTNASKGAYRVIDNN